MKPPRIRMNFPKFPVGFPHQRGVIERLTSIGDRVHYPCETMGTLEGFDEDGNWSKIHHNSYDSNSGWKNPCLKSASWWASREHVFLRYLALNVTCSFTDPVAKLSHSFSRWLQSEHVQWAARRVVCVKMLGTQWLWKIAGVRPKEGEQVVVAAGVFVDLYDGFWRNQKDWEILSLNDAIYLEAAMKAVFWAFSIYENMRHAFKRCSAFEEVQSSFQTILPFFSCIQNSCWKITVFNQHTGTHAIFHLWKFQRNIFNSETTIFHSQAVVFLWDNTAFFQEAVTRFLCRFGTRNFAGLGDQGIILYLMYIAYI